MPRRFRAEPLVRLRSRERLHEGIPSAMSSLSTPLYRFSQYVVDTGAHLLLKSDVRVPIQEQPFQILLELLERHGQVVTREALRRRLWGPQIFVDIDQSLNSAHRRLRIALDDDSRNPVYVETIPRIGFRFLAPFTVEEITVGALPGVPRVLAATAGASASVAAAQA